MLKANKLPISTWTSYVVLAFVFDQNLDIGTVNIEKKKESPQASLMFGFGNTQSGSKEAKRGWNVRGIRGEYIEGSIITVPIYKEEVAFALKKLKEKRVPYSSAVKNLIRKYLKIGEKTEPPRQKNTTLTENALVIESINKEDLRGNSVNKYSVPLPRRGIKEISEKTPSLESEIVAETETPNEVNNKVHCSIPDKSVPSSGKKNPLLDLI